MIRTGLLVFAALASGVFLGCSSSSSGTTSTGSGTTGRGSSTTSGASSTTSGGSTSTTGGLPYSGTITLSQIPSAGGGISLSPALSSASLVLVSGGPAAAACAGTQSGACCFVPNGASSGNVTPTSVSAGTIAFTDNGAGIGHVAFGSDTYPPLNSASVSTFTWASGDTLGVRNGGGVVDKFTGSLTAPAAIAGLAPPFSSTTLTTIPLGQDFAVSWTPSGDMQMSFSVTDANVGGITCTVPDSAGTLTVPTGLLSQLMTGDMGTVVVSRQNLSAPPLSTDNASVGYQVSLTRLGNVDFE